MSYHGVVYALWFISLSLCRAVERRRRDRINDMIKTLAQVVPGCQKKDSATGNVVGVSQTWPSSKSPSL